VTNIVNLAVYRRNKATHRVAELSSDREATVAAHDLPSGSVMFKPREGARADNRGDVRHRIDGALKLLLSINGKPAEIRNISRGGMMAEADCKMGPGAAVLIDISGCEGMIGTLVWRRGNLLGVTLPAEAMKLQSAS
jgi:hypothetical protein